MLGELLTVTAQRCVSGTWILANKYKDLDYSESAIYL